MGMGEHSIRWLFLSTDSRSNWISMLVFGGPCRKTCRARTRANNKLNPRVTQGPGIEPMGGKGSYHCQPHLPN